MALDFLGGGNIGGRARTAREVLAGMGRATDVLAVSAVAPTVTLSAANAATSIASGVLIAPQRTAAATQIDIANDSSYEYLGIRPGHLPVSSFDCCYADFLTGGSSQSRRDLWRPRALYSGSALEFRCRMRGSTFQYRIWVDGQPLALDYTSVAVTTGSRYNLKVDFGSAAPRIVELEVLDLEFAGTYIEPTASLTRPRLRRRTLMGLGDSITGGANGVQVGGTWLTWAARLLSMAWNNQGIGGTGYWASNGGVAAFNQRFTEDVYTQPPDVLVVFGGYNDVALKTAAEIQTQVTTDLTALAANLPDTCIIVVGDWVTGNAGLTTAHLNADAAIKAAAATVGVPFISLMDPAGIAGTATAWAATTAYVVGDVRVSSGVVQKCITSHTSGATFDQTKWRPQSFVQGTGKVGTATGDGNADLFISNDGTHPSLAGHKALGSHLGQQILASLRTIAGTS